MSDDQLRRAIEAVVLVAVEPVPARLLAELLEQPLEAVRTAADGLAAEYQRDHRGFVLVQVAGGYRFQTHPDLAPYVERFANREVSTRLSTAALESLAIVAYRQPVSRAQIAALRGVNVDGVVRLLEQRGYIEAVGRAPGPGQPVLYGTTELFLERLGLNDLGQLPPVADLLPGPEVAAELEEALRHPGADRQVHLEGASGPPEGPAGGPGHHGTPEEGATADPAPPRPYLAAPEGQEPRTPEG